MRLITAILTLILPLLCGGFLIGVFALMREEGKRHLRMRNLYKGFALLLLPSLLMAKRVEIKVVDNFYSGHPIGYTDRVSLRTTSSVTYQDNASFARGEFSSGKRQTRLSFKKIHWKNIHGGFERFNFDPQPTEASVDFDTEYDVGPFKVEFLKVDPGRMRYSKRGTSLEFRANFNEKIIYTVMADRIKEVVVLTSASQTRLAYSYKLNGHDPSKPLAEGQPIYGTDGMTNGFFPKLTAVDQYGESRSVAVTITADSLIAVLSSIAAGDTVWLDPTIQDTVLTGSAGQVYNDIGTNQQRRDDANGGAVNLLSALDAYAGVTGSSVARSAFQWKLGPLTNVTTMDSVNLRYFHESAMTGDNDTMWVSYGEWTSNTLAVGWFSLFDGRETATAHTFTNLVDSTRAIMTTANDGTWMTIPFTSAAADSIKDLINSTGVNDTLRIILIDADDYRNRVNDQANYFHTDIDSFPRLEIFHGGTPAGGPASVAGIASPASVAGVASPSKIAGIE